MSTVLLVQVDVAITFNRRRTWSWVRYSTSECVELHGPGRRGLRPRTNVYYGVQSQLVEVGKTKYTQVNCAQYFILERNKNVMSH